MSDDTTPRPARRRPHPAARARNATLALSLGAFGAITGGLAAHAASSTQASKTQTAASNTTATTSAVTSDDNSTTTSDHSTAAVPASNLSSGTAVTSSHGS